MSAFNTLQSPSVICPICGVSSVFEVQFKYGDTWQRHYAVGDADDLPFEIVVNEGRIEAVMPRPESHESPRKTENDDERITTYELNWND